MTTRHALTIAAGDIDIDALSFLHGHGAKSENSLGLTIVTLPGEAHADQDTFVKSQYYIWFYGADGEEEEQFLEVQLNIDAYETRVRVRKQ